METGNYICHLCEKEYEPTKRGRQKFCSSKCRKKYNYHKNIVPSDKSVATETISKPSKLKVDEMSFAGVGNAATGTLIADGLKEIVKAFQPEENKPVTKKETAPVTRTETAPVEQAENSVATVQEVLGDMMGDAPACNECGHITIRNGSCYKCLNCGNSLGCS